jgi:hypothetical protein
MAKSGTGREITLTAESKMAWIRGRDVAGEAKALLLEVFLLFIHDFVLRITVIALSFRFFLFVVVVVLVVFFVIIIVVFRDDV